MEHFPLIVVVIGGLLLVVKFVRLDDELKTLRQKLGLLESELRRLRERLIGGTPAGGPEAPAARPPVTFHLPEPGPPSSLSQPPPPAAEPAPPQNPFRLPELSVEEFLGAAKRPEPDLGPPPPAWHAPDAAPEGIPAAAAAGQPALAPALAPAISTEASQEGFNWELFMGVKLFAWLGGLALLLAVVFFIKYSFDQNLISQEMRAGAGFLTGIGLLAGGIFVKRKEYATTSQTLCAAGISILYATTFACRAYYHFEFAANTFTIFAMMVLITACAFVLAVKLDGMVIAILGVLGGFLTPPLLSTGVDQPAGLFSYIAILDAGLAAVAFRKRWSVLFLLGAAGTIAMQWGWVAQFFVSEKVWIAMAVFLGFAVLYIGILALGRKLGQVNRWLAAAAILPACSAFGLAVYFVGFSQLGGRPEIFLTTLFAADLCLLAATLLDPGNPRLHLAAGAATFIALAAWTQKFLSTSILNWALASYLAFSILHTLFPVLLERLRPAVRARGWARFFPPLALVLVLLPLFRDVEVSLFLWPCVLLIDLLAIGLAYITASLLSVLAVLALTAAATATWMLRIPAELAVSFTVLAVIGGFACIFFALTLYFGRKLMARDAPEPAAAGTAGTDRINAVLLPACSAVLPFLLLILATLRMPMADPSPIFGLALFMVVLLLGLDLFSKIDALAPAALAAALILEAIWNQSAFRPGAPLSPIIWHLAFSLVFTAYPFLFRRALSGRIVPWVAAALSGPLHFYLVYRVFSLGYPNPFPGFLPAAFAAQNAALMALAGRWFAAGHPQRLNLLALFGGAALFFITLIFPIQFEKQWLTISWALEGAALLWLFHRVPHPGLRLAGAGLLAVAFLRLAINPAILEYHEPGRPIFNWYLYAFGAVAICLFAGGRLLRPPRHALGNFSLAAILNALGAILVFILLNIEIVDYFSEGPEMRFEPSRNLGQNMTFTIAWAVYAFVLLMAGIAIRSRLTRYASFGLWAAILLKLFLSDLSQLNQLYRIAAFLAVAVILMVASFFYQRFMAGLLGGKKPAVPVEDSR